MVTGSATSQAVGNSYLFPARCQDCREDSERQENGPGLIVLPLGNGHPRRAQTRFKLIRIANQIARSASETYGDGPKLRERHGGLAFLQA